MTIAEKIHHYNSLLENTSCRLIAISKTKPNRDILAAYHAGQRAFGENKVQDLVRKYEDLPKDIRWHMVGHLQRNKVKYIAPFVHLIHSVDSVRLLEVIAKEGRKNNRDLAVLLQVHIAQEETKFGFSPEELRELLQSDLFKSLEGAKVLGLMGMATYTSDHSRIRSEFTSLKALFDDLSKMKTDNMEMKELSIGMSGDYPLALENGSTMIRIGTDIFGSRE